jgi:hypothetical protein
MAQIIDLGKIRFNWAGTYSAGTAYSYNDLVKYGANLYAYTNSVGNTGIVPTNTTYWTLVTEGISYKGTYTAATLYYKNDIVTDGTNTYIVLVQHTSTSSPVALGNSNLEIIALGQQGLPNQTGNINKLLTTDGTSTSWTGTTKLAKQYVGNNQGVAANDFETAAALTDAVVVASKSTLDFAQIAFVNTSNGVNASTDYIAYTADGDNDSGWIDMGITSADFDSANYGITGPHDGYIFSVAPTGVTRKDITAFAVAGGIATITTASAHGRSVGDVIVISGLQNSALNGKFTIASIVNSTKFTFVTTASSVGETAAAAEASMHKPNGNGNLVLATSDTGLKNNIVFAAGGLTAGTTQMEIFPNEKVKIEISTASTSATTGALVIDGGLGLQGDLFMAGSLNVDGGADFSGAATLPIGTNASIFLTELTNPTVVVDADNDDYSQIAFQNRSNHPNASTDYIAYTDNGTDDSGYIDMGITSSTFNDPDFTITGPNDGYIFFEAPRVYTRTVTNKSLTSNIATLTFSVSHTSEGYSGPAIGQKIVVSGVDATFNGTYTITALPTTSSVSYSKTAANVTSTTATGTATINTTGAGNLVLATGDQGTDNKIIFAAGGLSSNNEQMSITPDQNVHIEIATPSISPTTGALTVVGGVGIVGDVNIAGNITFGGSGTQISTANLAVTAPFIFTGDANTSQIFDLGLITEGKYLLGALPTAVPISSSLTSNVATITTNSAHNFLAGDSVVITNVGAPYDGTNTITAIVNATSFSYAKTNANISTASIGDVVFSIDQKTLASNVATLQTTATHSFLIGDTVVVAGVDSTFNGTYTITDVTGTTFSYAKTNINVPITAATGTATVNRSTATAIVGAPIRTRYNSIFKDATDGITKFISNISTEPTTSIDLNQATYGTPDIVWDTIKVGGIQTTGSASIGTSATVGTTLGVSGLLTANGGISTSGTLTATGGVNLSGTVDVQELREQVVEVTLSSNAVTLDWSAGNIYYIGTAPTGAMTFNATNVPTDVNKIMTINVFVTQGSTGYIPTTFNIGGVSQTIRWPGGTAPSPTNTAGKIDIFAFTMHRTSAGAWIVYGASSLNF